MATDHNNHHAQHSDVAYEHSDLNHRGILAFLIFLGVSTIVIFIAIGALYKGFGYAQAKLQPAPGPMAVREQSTVAKEQMQNTSDVNIQKFSANGTQPVLQSNDAADMDQFRKNEEALLNATPWKEENGNVHLPISRAMEVVMQRNQPSRANAANPSNFDPKLVPTEAGFPAVAAVHQEADASMVEGAPSEETQGEHPSATPEQKLKTPPPSAKAPKN